MVTLEETRNLRPLSRKEASNHLLERYGIHHSPGTLAKLACLGGGPIYRKAGARAIYEIQELERYAASVLSEPRHSTSQAA